MGGSLFLVGIILSFAVTFLLCLAMGTYVLRTWRMIRSGPDGSHQDDVIDRLDQLQVQLSVLMERLPESSENPAELELVAGFQDVRGDI